MASSSAEIAAAALLELAPRLGRLLTVALDSADGQRLTLRQFRILQRLAARPHRSGELASSTGVSAPTMSVAVAALEADGLVRREPDPEDGRASLIMLTDAGRAAHEQAEQRVRALLVDVAADLQDDDAAALQRLRAPLNEGIDRVRRQMREEAAPRSSGQPRADGSTRSSRPGRLPTR